MYSAGKALVEAEKQQKNSDISALQKAQTELEDLNAKLAKATEVNPNKPFLLDGEAITKISLVLKELGDSYNAVFKGILEQLKTIQGSDLGAVQKAAYAIQNSAESFNVSLQAIDASLREIKEVLARNAALEYMTLQNVNEALKS